MLTWNVLNLIEDDLQVVVDEIVNNEDFEKIDTEVETIESIEELKYPQEYEDGGIITLDDLNERDMNDSRVQALFEQSRKIVYLLSYSVEITTNYWKELSELLEISTISSNLTIS